MDKKASVLMYFIEVAVAFLAIVTLLNVGQAAGESSTLRKERAAEDIRMMADVLVGVPGTALVQYPHNVSEFTFILEQRSITVFRGGEPEAKSVNRALALPEGYAAQGSVEHPATLCLQKKGTTIILRGCP